MIRSMSQVGAIMAGVVRRRPEAMHPLGPLQRHQRAFQARQQKQGQRHGQGGEDRGQHQRLGPVSDKDEVDQGGQDVTYDQDGQIGRAIVGALVVQRLAADRTRVADLEEVLQHRPRAATGAAAAPATAQGRAKGPIFGDGVGSGESKMRGHVGAFGLTRRF